MSQQKQQDNLDPCYILHSRKYRDTSVILEVFGLNKGRQSVVVRGARSAKSRLRGQLQPFTPLLVAAKGRSELRTGTAIDMQRRAWRLSGESLMLGLYVNELLYRLLGRFDPMPGLYQAYEGLLEMLQAGYTLLDVRRFELRLLQELGYGVDFSAEAITGEPLDASVCYQYVPGEGFRRASDTREGQVPGAQLCHVNDEAWEQVDELLLRTITRRSIRPLLGDRALNSGSLFRGMGPVGASGAGRPSA